MNKKTIIFKTAIRLFAAQGYEATTTLVAEEPELMGILLRTCPARLDDPENKCTKIYRQARSNLKDTTKKIIKKGMASGNFIKVDLEATANMLIALLNGLMHQQIVGMDILKGVEAATIEFCRNALVANT